MSRSLTDPLTVVIPGRPRPKARPRPGSRGGWFVPSNKHQEYVAMHFLGQRGRFAEGDIRMDANYYVHTRARLDGDNLQKLLQDALQDAGVISNDDQIKQWSGQIIACAKGDERTVVRLAPVAQT